MNAFIEFIKEYWFQLVAAMCFVVEIVFIFIKRKPKSIDDFKLAFSDALALTADLVSKVERPGEGFAKKVEVESLAKAFIERRLGRGLTVSECTLVKEQVDTQIETVLAAPTKKEIKDEK